MNRKFLFWPLAAMLLMACEKGLDVGEDGMSSDVGQVKNSVLQVRTRSGGSGSEATVAYPVTVYVFAGEECKAAQTIGDEGQTLNIALVEGTYSVYAVGGVSTTDYVLPAASDALVTSAIDFSKENKEANVILHMTMYEQEPFTRAVAMFRLVLTDEEIPSSVSKFSNQITRYTGSFFGSGGSGQQTDGTFRLTADPDWDSVNGYTF